MQDLTIREQKMQARRKQTPWREFVKEICSWQPMSLYKENGMISKYKSSPRVGKVISEQEFLDYRENLPTGELGSNGFLQSVQHLYQKTQFPATLGLSNQNCTYTEMCAHSKNTYLSINSTNSENVLYSFQVKRSTDIYNCVGIWEDNSIVYQSSGIIRCHKVFYTRNLHNCSDIRFSKSLDGCQECLFCHDLINQQYCIYNKKYEKNEYHKEKSILLKQKEKYLERYFTYCINTLSQNDRFVIYSENVENGILINEVKNSRNIILVNGGSGKENFYDCFGPGRAKDMYATSNGGSDGQKIYCSTDVYGGSNIYYSCFPDHCSYCLGCIGLKNKSFCILNKQYEKEERFKLANEIFVQMDADGTLGQFFPASMNPFYFNDTVAYLIDDTFTKEEVTKDGYLRRDEEIRVDIPEGSEIVETENLASRQGFDVNGNRTIDPDILKKVIRDPKGNVYRIQKMEYDFLMKYGLPIPELHWLDRIKLGFKFK